MSITLLFLVPIGLVAVAWSLCFVGCVFQTGGIAIPYSNNILAEQTLVAYWPLGDFPGSSPPPPFPPPPQGSTSIGTAVDLSMNGNHTGSYIIPPAYQSGTTVPQIANPTLNLRQPSIVPGDVSESGIVDKNLFPGSTDFEGGYVSIPWAQNSTVLDQFTLEAWIKPNWTQAQSGFLWVLFGAASNNSTGFALYINDKNNWQVTIGNGAGLQVFDTMVPADLTSSKATYVALVGDSGKGTGIFKLWINPLGTGDTDPPTPPPANWTSPGSTGYVALDPTQQPVTFFIGAGDNNNAQTLRTQPMGTGGPLDPFRGQIQNVALYSSMLDPATLQTHFTSGSGA